MRHDGYVTPRRPIPALPAGCGVPDTFLRVSTIHRVYTLCYVISPFQGCVCSNFYRAYCRANDENKRKM